MEEMEMEYTAELSAAPEPAPTVDPVHRGAEEVDFRAICRACAFKFDPSILRDITPPIRDTLLDCTGIEIDIMSKCASRICRTCMSRADDASQFKLQCHQAEKKLRPLVPAPSPCPSPVPAPSPAGHPVSSTPLHIQDDGANFYFRSPTSILSAFNVGIEELLNEEYVATPNLEDSSVMSPNFVNAILEDGIISSDEKKSLEENQENISFSESVLDFLNTGTQGRNRDSIRSENVLDDSFIGSFIIPAKRDDDPSPERINNNKTEQNPQTVNRETEIEGIKKIDSFFFETIPVDEIIKMYPETEMNDEKNNLKKDDEENNNKNKLIIVTVVDYIKSSMPKQEITKEINELGHARCRYCYKAFDNINDIYLHLARKHGNDCADSSGLDYVKLSMPELTKLQTLNEAGFVRCRYCWNAKFTNFRKLYQHLNKYHYDKCKKTTTNKIMKSTLYTCNDCGRQFRTKKNLERHLRVHENRQHKWQCSLCGRVFATLSSQKSHMLSHENKVCGPTEPTSDPPKDRKKFICSVCGNNFSNASNLNVHLRRHNPDNAIRCSVCDKGFKVAADLKHHMKMHSKLQECHICSKTYSRSDHLTNHIRTHTGERTYKCTECEYDFVWSMDLKRHIQRIHRLGININNKKRERASGTEVTKKSQSKEIQELS